MSITSKPKWLNELEKQSWQAELIASGLAIYGSLALGDLLDRLLLFAAASFPDRILDVLTWVFIYLYLIHSTLVVAFIAHLILRIVWAGLIGLSSVYPDGINLDNKTYPRHFLEDAKREFPSLSAYSIKVDAICSKVFSSLCMLIFIFLSIMIWLIMLLGVSELIFRFTGIYAFKYLLGLVLGIYLVYTVFFTIYGVGKKKDSDIAKRYAYKLNRGFGKAMMLMFYEPASYIMWTQRSNQTTKQFASGIILMMFISFITGVKSSNVISVLEKKEYHELNALDNDANALNYMDTNGDSRIVRPVIQSKNVNDAYLDVFIPKLVRENMAREQICGKFKSEGSRRDLNVRADRYQFIENCAKSYYELYIDDNRVEAVNYEYLHHPHKGEKGYQTHIPIDHLDNGYHQLKIETGYTNESGDRAVRIIPFYKVN